VNEGEHRERREQAAPWISPHLLLFAYCAFPSLQRAERSKRLGRPQNLPERARPRGVRCTIHALMGREGGRLSSRNMLHNSPPPPLPPPSSLSHSSPSPPQAMMMQGNPNPGPGQMQGGRMQQGMKMQMEEQRKREQMMQQQHHQFSPASHPPFPSPPPSSSAHHSLHPHHHSAACNNCETFVGPAMPGGVNHQPLMNMAHPASFSSMPRPPPATAALPSQPSVAAFVQLKQDWPSFSILQTHPRFASLTLRCDEFHPLRQWFPWIDWDGSWIESYPMQTSFRVQAQMMEQTVKGLMRRGFMAQQSRLAARM
jgi:hypothetical protein